MSLTLSVFAERFLFVSDPNLGPDGFSVFSKYFPGSSCFIWRNHSHDTNALREYIQSRSWLLTVSFYNDYVFQQADFPFLGLVLNLHPSLPCIRGVGYDHVPLIEHHEYHGCTLHQIDPPGSERINPAEDIDSGTILRVIKQRLPPGTTHTNLRRRNQALLLEALRELCVQLATHRSIKSFQETLMQASQTNDYQWSPTYMSRERLHDLLRTIQNDDPTHPVFL